MIGRREGKCKKNKRKRRKNNRKHGMQEGDGEKVIVGEGSMRDGMVTGRKKAAKKNKEKAARRKVNYQVDATRRSYSEAVIEGALRTEMVIMGDPILRMTDKTLSKGE